MLVVDVETPFFVEERNFDCCCDGLTIFLFALSYQDTEIKLTEHILKISSTFKAFEANIRSDRRYLEQISEFHFTYQTLKKTTSSIIDFEPLAYLKYVRSRNP